MTDLDRQPSQPHPPGADAPDADAPDASWVDGHVTILGYFHIAYSVITLLMALFGAVFMMMGGILSGDQEAMAVTGTLAAAVFCVLAVLSLPGLLGGIFLLRRRPWARLLVLILAFVYLLNFPLGTALGVYSLYILLRSEAADVFH